LPTDHERAACVYFAADRSLYAEKLIVLNANGDVFVNNVQQISNVAPEYAPPGRHLISCAIVGLPSLSDEDMFSRAKEDLARLFEDYDAISNLQPLSVARIEFAQFAQPPGIKSILPANFSGIPGLYFAAEFTTFSSINGAISSGEQAAAAILTHRAAARAS
jgi:phytoene dehydrogenase-like protein